MRRGVIRPNLPVYRPLSVAPLAYVDFASDAAEKLAKDNALRTEEFGDREPSGKGGFTLADVREVLEAREGS